MPFVLCPIGSVEISSAGGVQSTRCEGAGNPFERCCPLCKSFAESHLACFLYTDPDGLGAPPYQVVVVVIVE